MPKQLKSQGQTPISKDPYQNPLLASQENLKKAEAKVYKDTPCQFADDVKRSIEDGSYERVPNGGLSSFDAIEKEANTLNPDVKKELSLFDEGIGSKGEVEQTKTLDTATKEEIQMAPEMNNAVIHVDDIDPNTGMPFSKTLTMKEIMDDIAQDEKAINRLKGCI